VLNIGEIRTKERGYLPTNALARVLSATVSESAGRWFVSLQVEQEIGEPRPAKDHVVGVDVGIKHLAVTSDGEVFANPRALARMQKALRVRQKAVSRKVKGSKNRKKAGFAVAKLHKRAANIRRDSIHKMTASIAKSASVIVVEDLNIAGMLKNHKLAGALSDASLGEILRQLGYKSKWCGVDLRRADRFYPSSKQCSKCGAVKEALSLRERTYTCECCGLSIDRDLNAALNLKNLAASSAATACCPESAGLISKSDETLGWAGTEPVRASCQLGERMR
jgi:putative transposase